MSHLPVIVGFGGINPAGRSSFNHAYRRLIIDKLPEKDRQATILSLATISNLVTVSKDKYLCAQGEFSSIKDLVKHISAQVLENSLIRKIGSEHFDVEAMVFNKAVSLKDDSAITFTLTKRQLPHTIPDNWQVDERDNHHFHITWC